MELLEDDDFQRDSDHGRLDDVVADIKARPQLYEKWVLSLSWAVSCLHSLSWCYFVSRSDIKDCMDARAHAQ